MADLEEAIVEVKLEKGIELEPKDEIVLTSRPRVYQQKDASLEEIINSEIQVEPE